MKFCLPDFSFTSETAPTQAVIIAFHSNLLPTSDVKTWQCSVNKDPHKPRQFQIWPSTSVEKLKKRQGKNINK